MFKSTLLGLLLAIGLQAPIQAAEPGLYQPRAGAPAGAPGPAARAAPRAAVIENGRQCSVINFEGVGDLSVIPEFDGVSSPGWMGIIDADAGGSGNFAQEPSPETIAFWLGGNPGSRDIVFSNKASKVEFHYTSFVTVTMQALDEAGTVLATSVGEHRTYYGMVRPAVPGTVGGIAAGIPSHAALGRTSVTRLGAETVQEVVAHEVGHTLGLRHTNTQVPAAAAPPGCYGLAAARGSDWPFADNRIESAARLEVGS